jgi:hypothetical protein
MLAVSSYGGAMPRFDSLRLNILHLAKHGFRTRRYGLEVNEAALRVLKVVDAPGRISHVDLATVILAVMKASADTSNPAIH